MTNTLERRLEAELEQFIRDGVYKRLNYLDSPQGPRVKMEGRGEVIILSSNNYLGSEQRSRRWSQAGKAALDRCGAGTASVRFICGTFTVHRELESAWPGWWERRRRSQLRQLLERQRGGARHAAGRGGHRASAISSTTPPSSTACGWPRRSPSARRRSTSTPTWPTWKRS